MNAWLDQIVFADRGAAGRHQNVGLERCALRRIAAISLDSKIIAHNTEIRDLGAFFAGQRRKRKAVGVDDLSRFRFGARRVTSWLLVANSGQLGGGGSRATRR